MKSVNALRHGKETGYFTVMAIVGAIVWVIALFALLASGYGIFVVILFALIGLFVGWLSDLYFKAVIFGDSVHVNANQFPEIHQIVKAQCAELGISVPRVFIVNSDGVVNALAVRRLAKKYVILQSALVDLLLKDNRMDDLSVVIGHELAHHAAGHVGIFRNLLILPGRIIPLIGAAYGRACELTADRIGYALVGDKESAERALIALSLGSRALKSQVNAQAFMAQEYDIPWLMGFIHKLYCSHPRMTRRVIEIQKYEG